MIPIVEETARDPTSPHSRRGEADEVRGENEVTPAICKLSAGCRMLPRAAAFSDVLYSDQRGCITACQLIDLQLWAGFRAVT